MTTPFPVPSPPPVPCSFSAVPETRAVPRFEPLRVPGRGRLRPGRALRRGRRAPAAVLALASAALAVSSATGAGAGEVSAGAPGPHAPPVRQKPTAVRLVSAPVRIADAATVRLLRPGDRVDVIAAPGRTSLGGGGDGEARVVATGARVTGVPRPADPGPDAGVGADGGSGGERGALIVLSVPRSVATALAGAGMASQLAVVLC
ncbi:hypothetical protein EAO71_16390 [Streptomyces sp. ms191]|uniref:RcpC/CpaB family pilus assembly protein n=1 Tax=Streptomyces sp. ms191 TaxID=1827978 RepID=UPI0011CD4EB1|nr:hypothetical protein EAO71_16390 [Streptomyces sp. ms191]